MKIDLMVCAFSFVAMARSSWGILHNQPLVQATGQYELDPSGKLTTTYDSGQLDVWPFCTKRNRQQFNP